MENIKTSFEKKEYSTNPTQSHIFVGDAGCGKSVALADLTLKLIEKGYIGLCHGNFKKLFKEKGDFKLLSTKESEHSIRFNPLKPDTTKEEFEEIFKFFLQDYLRLRNDGTDSYIQEQRVIIEQASKIFEEIKNHREASKAWEKLEGYNIPYPTLPHIWILLKENPHVSIQFKEYLNQRVNNNNDLIWLLTGDSLDMEFYLNENSQYWLLVEPDFTNSLAQTTFCYFIKKYMDKALEMQKKNIAFCIDEAAILREINFGIYIEQCCVQDVPINVTYLGIENLPLSKTPIILSELWNPFNDEWQILEITQKSFSEMTRENLSLFIATHKLSSTYFLYGHFIAVQKNKNTEIIKLKVNMEKLREIREIIDENRWIVEEQAKFYHDIVNK